MYYGEGHTGDLLPLRTVPPSDDRLAKDRTMTQNSSPPQANQPQGPPLGLDFNQKWQLIQHFTDWIKHGDAKLQMLLTVEGVIVAGYGAFLPVVISAGKAWNTFLIIFNIIFAFFVVATFGYGFFKALQPYTKKGKNDLGNKNIFFYGTYSSEHIVEDLNNSDAESISKNLDSQIAVLGAISSNKFNNVKILQTLIFLNIVIFFIIILLYYFTQGGK